MAMQLLANEYFTCKSLTANILPENSPYLHESTDFVQHELIFANAGYQPISRNPLSRNMVAP
jgi:hypothetical protein